MYTLTQLTDELANTPIVVVPETVEPLAGEVIFTSVFVGAGVGVGTGPDPFER